jgi:hypothetical protein
MQIRHVSDGHVCEELRSEEDSQPENQNQRCVVGKPHFFDDIVGHAYIEILGILSHTSS